MKLYQAAQQKYKTDIKKKVTRQVQIVKPDATDEDVDAVLKSEGGRDALYKERILAGGVNDQIGAPRFRGVARRGVELTGFQEDALVGEDLELRVALG